MTTKQVQSAYFPSSIEESTKSYPSIFKYRDTMKIESSNEKGENIIADGGIYFPRSSAILWDRTGVAPPIYLNVANIIPAIVLSRHDINRIIRSTSDSLGDSFDAPALVCQTNHLAENYKLSISRRPGSSQASSGYIILGKNSFESAESELTIPFLCKDSQDSNLIALENIKVNLWRAMKSSRVFSLKNFMRIKALAKPNYQLASDIMTSVTVRFEAIFPNLSIQLLPIPPLSILSTPLTNTLFMKKELIAGNGIDRRPNAGYLTLNQTRKAVLLLESDPAVSLAPLVGVWLRMDDCEITEVVKHPYCWAIALRFLLNVHISKRVFVSQETFLMIIIIGDSIHCFESSLLSSFGSGGITKCELPCQFLSADFTAELSIEEEESSDSEVIVGKFKTSAKLEERSVNTSSAPRFSPVLLTKSIESQPSKDYTFEEEKSICSAAAAAAAAAGCDVERESLPQPRQIPVPHRAPVRPAGVSLNSAAGCYSSLVTAATNEADSNISGSPYLQFDAIRSTLTDVIALNGAQRAQYAFPAEIILAQQRQIAQLQSQVEDLRRIVESLGVKVPVESFNEFPDLQKSFERRDESSDLLNFEKESLSIDFQSYESDVIRNVDALASDLNAVNEHCRVLSEQESIVTSTDVRYEALAKEELDPIKAFDSEEEEEERQKEINLSEDALFSKLKALEENPPQRPPENKSIYSDYTANNRLGTRNNYRIPRKARSFKHEEPSVLRESESILAIEAKYLSQRK